MQCFPPITIGSEVVLTFGLQCFDYDRVGMIFLLVLCGGQLSSCTCALISFIHVRWPMAIPSQTFSYSYSPLSSSSGSQLHPFYFFNLKGALCVYIYVDAYTLWMQNPEQNIRSSSPCLIDIFWEALSTSPIISLFVYKLRLVLLT